MEILGKIRFQKEINCIYCGEEKSTEKIANPNLDLNEDIDWDDKNSWWLVCKDCKDTIHYQSQISLYGYILYKSKDNKEKEIAIKMIDEANNKLLEISKRIKKPILNATIYKKEDGSFGLLDIEFTGEK